MEKDGKRWKKMEKTKVSLKTNWKNIFSLIKRMWLMKQVKADLEIDSMQLKSIVEVLVSRNTCQSEGLCRAGPSTQGSPDSAAVPRVLQFL